VRRFIEAWNALSLGKEEEEKRMCKLKARKIWISAFLAFMLAFLLAGCGDLDGGPGNPGDPLLRPP
jgi:hypothetical protein